MSYLLKLENIHKSFPGVKVLKNVSMYVKPGEIHALLGENGAGKSTLMKILGGIHKQESGTLTFLDEPIGEVNPEVSKRLGIGFVHQELNLSDELTVAENIYMGRLPEKSWGIIDHKQLYAQTEQVLAELDVSFTAKTKVRELTTANKQLVEIAKAISLDARVVIFDEPTTSLSDKDVKNLFAIIRKLSNKGVACIYISHRMKEIFELCEQATILRDGELIDSVRVADVDQNQIIRMIVGRELSDFFPKSVHHPTDTTLEVSELCDEAGRVKSVSFMAKRGEVLGFSGLVGSGRTELVRMLFGADLAKSGSVSIGGKLVSINSPVTAIQHGICLLTEDRKHQGLALGMSIIDNINLTAIDSPLINDKKLRATADKYVQALKIKVSNVANPVSSLSGGNQQKVVLGKWLNKDADIFIFDEPTKGIDVGAKAEIYEIIDNLAKSGKTIIVISSEIPELLGITDRIYVMCEGKITGCLERDRADAESIMKLSVIGGAA